VLRHLPNRTRISRINQSRDRLRDRRRHRRVKGAIYRRRLEFYPCALRLLDRKRRNASLQLRPAMRDMDDEGSRRWRNSEDWRILSCAEMYRVQDDRVGAGRRASSAPMHRKRYRVDAGCCALVSSPSPKSGSRPNADFTVVSPYYREAPIALKKSAV